MASKLPDANRCSLPACRDSANARAQDKNLHYPAILWLTLTTLLALPLASHASADLLSPEQRLWLQNHPSIKLAPDPDFPPIEYIDSNGRYRGIAADYITLLEQKLNIQFQIVVLPSWDDVLDAAKSRNIDMFGAAAATPQREQYMQFTAPHIELPGVIIVNTKVEKNLNLKDLHGLKVAVVSGYVWHELIERDHPEIKLLPVPDLLTGLNQVSFGNADAMVANLAIATHYIEKSGITNLRVTGETGYYGRYALAVRKDWPELIAILEKGLAAISTEERAGILKKWVALAGKTSMLESRTFWIILLSSAVLIVVLSVLWWNRALRKEVAIRTASLHKEFSERKRVEQAYGHSEKRYRTLFDAASDAVFMYKDNAICECNDAAMKMFSCDRAYLLSAQPGKLSPQFQPDGSISQEKAAARVADCLLGKPQLFEWRYLRRDQSEFDAEVSLNAHTDTKDGQAYILAIIRDITERKHTERLKDEFVSTVSHEIRTPLTSIKGSLGLMKGGKTGKLSASTNRILDIAYNNTERMLLLVNDLLDIQKLESGKIKLSKKTFSLNAFLKQAMIANQSYADQYNVEFQQVASEDIMITADYDRLMQVMNNLMSNAAKYSPTKDIVKISTEVIDNMVRVRVKDNGPGIPHQFRSQVFGRFTQSDASDTRKLGGTGLGLSITKAILQLHGGNIDFITDPRLGTEFYFELPSSNKT